MVQTHQTFSLDPWRAGVYDCAARSSNGSQVERAWVASIAVDRKSFSCQSTFISIVCVYVCV